MRLILLYKDKKEKYTGDAEPRKEWEHYLIPKESYEAQLIADLIEYEFGFSNATCFVNLWREENGKTHVGRSCVYEVVKRLKPQITMIQKRAQGSFNLDSGWCRANHRWATQLLIKFRLLAADEVPKKFF